MRNRPTRQCEVRPRGVCLVLVHLPDSATLVSSSWCPSMATHSAKRYLAAASECSICGCNRRLDSHPVRLAQHVALSLRKRTLHARLAPTIGGFALDLSLLGRYRVALAQLSSRPSTLRGPRERWSSYAMLFFDCCPGSACASKARRALRLVLPSSHGPYVHFCAVAWLCPICSPWACRARCSHRHARCRAHSRAVPHRHRRQSAAWRWREDSPRLCRCKLACFG